jgi:endonuclease YncB( thermonuclease family)
VRLLLALYCCFALGAQAGTFSAKVIVVMDGDTVMALRGGHKIKIRLANIDAPEKEQGFGRQSRDSLREMVGKKVVRIDSLAVDRYGRIVGLISVDGHNINQEQVRRGMAWASKSRQPTPEPSEGHIPADDIYIKLQNEARQARRGLWVQPNPQIPWRWRKLHPPLIPSPQANSRDTSVQADALLLSRSVTDFPAVACGG